jgi:hypothetical protein
MDAVGNTYTGMDPTSAAACAANVDGGCLMGLTCQ